MRDLEQLWLTEAGRNDVLPMSEGLTSRLDALLPSRYAPSSRKVIYPGSPVTDESLPFLIGGFRIDVDVTTGDQTPGGILCAFGDWNGGFALYAIDGRLTFAFRPAGVLVQAVAECAIPVGDHVLTVECRPRAAGLQIDLGCDGEPVGSLSTGMPMPFSFQHGGTQLRIGHDTGLPVVEEYHPPFEWTGSIRRVTFEALAAPALPSAEEVADAMRND